MATLHMARPTSPYNSSSSDTDSIIANVPTGTALRRLYFKTAKSGKMQSSNNASNNKSSSGPKAIVMNSSCNSTINTSTESASTHLTNITTTTDTETCDSLDLGSLINEQKVAMNRKFILSFYPLGDGDTTEQHEPLLSESQDESLTLLGQSDLAAMDDEKHSSVINVNEDLDESITPLLEDDDDGHTCNEVMN